MTFSGYILRRITGTAVVALDPSQIEQYRRKLYYKVSHHVGSSCPDLEDLVQETVVRFLGALESEKFRNPDSMAAFLSGICNNVIHEYKRQTEKEPLREPLTDEYCDEYVPSGSEAPLMRQAIGLALAQLPTRDRELLRKFYLEEKDRSEMCRDLGQTEVQFRVTLFRAKQRFKQIYEDLVKRNVPERH
jgi:RNA polymerase sigma-70 factor (ECF subfamily)